MGVISGKIRILELLSFLLISSGFLMFFVTSLYDKVCPFPNFDCSLQTAGVLFAALRVWHKVALRSAKVA